MATLGRSPGAAPLTSADIPDNSITAAKIVDATILAGDLAPDSVDSSELVDGSIDTSHIGNLQVTAAKVAADVATQAELDAQRTNSSITTLGTVTAGTLTNGVVQVMPRNKGLIIEYQSATAVDIDADYLTVYDTNNYGVVLSAVNLTMTITSTGAGGRSASENSGSEKTSDWYHLWVIYNGSTIASYATLSFSESTVLSDLPSGYTHLKYVGAIYNDSYANLEPMYQIDNDVTVYWGNVLIVNDADINSVTAYDLANYLPDTVTSAHMGMRINDDDTAQYRGTWQFYLDSAGTYVVAHGGQNPQGSVTFSGLMSFDTVRVSPIINRTVYVNTSSSIGDSFTMELQQYTHNNII
jgi:hypothetical protein